HDAEIVAADLDVAAKHPMVALKTPMPVVVADHHERFCPRDTILGRSKDPAKAGRHTQDVEGFAGHELASGLLDRSIFVWNLDIRQVSVAEKPQSRGIARSGAELLKRRIAPYGIFNRPFFPLFLNLQSCESE